MQPGTIDKYERPVEITGGSEPEGTLLADCRRLLERYEARFAGNPQAFYRQLCLLALEREQLVSYGYREDVLGRRLDACTGDPEVLELFRYALLQVWRDEEAHTVFVRGDLFADEPPIRSAKVLCEQSAGLLAGWSSALKHHTPRSRAPLRSLVIDGLALGARVVGKLSPELRAELAYKTFREYCWYNVDAEETAELCWRRIIELDHELDIGNSAAFTRIAVEEDEHRQVFKMIAESLDTHDRVLPGCTPDDISDRLAQIGPRMVAPSYRSRARQESGVDAPRESTFGTGGQVHIVGDETGDKHAAVAEILERLGLKDVAGRTVAIKASWMMGYSRKDPSTITDPELLRQLLETLKAGGAVDVTIMDGVNLYSELYRNRSVLDVAAHFGITELGCRIEDTGDEVTPLEDDGLGSAPLGPEMISKTWQNADIRISVTRLRSHPTEHVHLTTANLEGLVEDSCVNVFWNRSYEYSVAAVAVGTAAPPTHGIIDAWEDCPDGWFGIMAGPNPRHPRRIYGASDCLAADLVALGHTGSVGSVDSPTLRRSIEWFGDPRSATEVVGDDTPIAGWRNPYRNPFSGFMADISYPVYRWLSKGGAVFAPPMDSEFVESKPLPAVLRCVRTVARWALGVRPPKNP